MTAYASVCVFSCVCMFEGEIPTTVQAQARSYGLFRYSRTEAEEFELHTTVSA